MGYLVPERIYMVPKFQSLACYLYTLLLSEQRSLESFMG